MATYILLGTLVVIGLYFISVYNALVRLRNMVEEAWSGIDVQLKKRYNLIPNLVNTVKGYATHEKEVLEGVTAQRAAGMNAKTVKEQEAAESAISQSLLNLFAVAENYPDLKANQGFLDLQRELGEIEDDIQKARRYYNGSVRNYNIKVEQFPSSLVASMSNHEKRDYFELIEANERANPTVDFS